VPEKKATAKYTPAGNYRSGLPKNAILRWKWLIIAIEVGYELERYARGLPHARRTRSLPTELKATEVL